MIASSSSPQACEVLSRPHVLIADAVVVGVVAVV